MDFTEAVASLNKLLGCNTEILDKNRIRKLVKKRMLQWHPDKNLENPDLFKEEFMELQDAWKKFNSGHGPSEAGPSQSSGFQEDEFVWSDPSDDDDYNSTPFSDEFFIPSPKKSFAVPDEIRCFFRAGSNRRAGKFFALVTVQSNFKFLKNFYSELALYCGNIHCFIGWGTRTNKEIFIILIQFNTERRLVDVKKTLRRNNIAPASLFYAVKIKNFIKFCYEKYGELSIKNCIPSEKETSSKPETSKFNHKLIFDYALSHQISDVFELMYEYEHLGQPCDRDPYEISKDHEDDHDDHRENAKAFTHMSDRKRIAKNAIDSVFAHLFMNLKKEKPEEFIDRRCNEIANSLLEKEDCKIFGEADFYARYHFKRFKSVSLLIINSFLHGTPRCRWTILKGDYKSGKTSYANAVLKFFEGVNINVNIDKQRLPFYLGQSIGKRFALFDDVKGRATADLQGGWGFSNIDDLRDHIDGHVEVQLEKKKPAADFSNIPTRDNYMQRLPHSRKCLAKSKWTNKD